MSQPSFLLLLSLSIVLISCSLLGSKSTSDLFKAVELGDVTGANQALGSQADINASHFVRTPLLDPCHDGKYGSIRSPLSLAAFQGNEPMVTFLIEKGANLETPSPCTPLALAVIANKPDIARILISKGASLMLTTKSQNPNRYRGPTTVLMLAASKNRSDMIELLSEKKTGLDQADRNGRTALFYAAESGYSESIRALVKHGASINYQVPDSGQTALAIAVVNQKVEAIRVLLALGADPNIPYKVLGVLGLAGTRTVTPLAIARQGRPDIVSLLEQAGAKDSVP